MKKLLIVLALIAAPMAQAVEPSEILPDPAQEARAREISKGLRCLVCRNESIDDSNADLARDLRVLVRERITAGDSNKEVVEFVVDRYGEYVLLRPLASGSNLVLYIIGPVALLAALGIGFIYLRGRRRPAGQVPDGLSAAEAARLKEIMKD
ncbi:cytochrome C biogenesis protein [Actibacterium atlanticum]|uniref:Cytochrome c-type biogenesis protein n=1 Tax=Actibacterium atlanticum TaxID=1461693 RepID=A0A058ZPB5_9RHOB|nr:cytochrome c-type biogenesis protein [Actibacterium atlanticum]KCV83408.1 cytochrome C biogenesis protein [Actibacterium atlanticum]